MKLKGPNRTHISTQYMNIKIDENIKEFKINVPGVTCYYKITRNRYTGFYYKSNMVEKPHLFAANNQHEFVIYLETLVKSTTRKLIQKSIDAEKMNLKKLNAQDNTKIGDIFYTSWGYEQTNVSFFQVVERPTKASVIIRMISHNLSDVNGMSGYAFPVKDDFIGEPIRKTFNKYGNIAKAEYSYDAKVWHGEKVYTSWGY